MDNRLMRDGLAEFIGTFTLVFIGAGAVIIAQGNVIIPALAHGLILVGIIATYGHISGAHVNPAVTLALLIGKQINAQRAVLYFIAQIVGGIVAALVLRVVFPDNLTSLGQTVPGVGITGVQVMVIEALLTFFFVSVIYQAAVYGKVGNIAAIAIGVTLAACILFGGTLTGASLNPARTLGPGLITGDLREVVFYLIGTLGGGALGGLVHVFLYPNPTSK